MAADRSNSLGRYAEDFAAKHYQKLGYDILTKNFFNYKGRRIGEIDFVAIKHRSIRFVEVKARSSNRFGSPEEVFDSRKRAKMKSAVNYFLVCFKQYRDFSVHIDLVAIELSKFDNSVRKFTMYSDCMI